MSDNILRLIVEKNIPYVKGVLEPYAEVRYLAPEEFTPEAVSNCDGMIIRTRTYCNADLLDASAVKFIATATIGTDHIDLPYCASRNIEVANAPGCNAPAVAQYVFASLLQVINRPLQSYTIGIVGVGHVGSIVERWSRALGMRVLLCDPLRQEAEGGDCWCDLDTIAERADIVTFHTPLTKAGAHPTYHLANEAFFAKCKRAPIIINSARGPITDTEAMLSARREGVVGGLIIDCWEGEPVINADLLALADVATPHIAGYSIEGKIRASQAAVNALTRHFNLPSLSVTAPEPPQAARAADLKGIRSTFDPMPLSVQLKKTPNEFEHIRNTYALRHEAPEGHFE